MTEPRSWRLTFWYPKLPLSLNDRRHRMVVYRVQKQVRDRVRQAARAQGVPRLQSIHMAMHWTPSTNRGRDEDNAVATLKSAIDGLRDYPARYRNVNGQRVLTAAPWVGVVADDTAEFVTWDRPCLHPANSDPLFTERLILIITEGARQ
jgi:hypothetical protein